MARESEPEAAFRVEGTCPKCGAEWIVDEVLVADRGHGDVPKQLSLMVRMKPWALLFKGTRYFPLDCRICAGCGSVELRVRKVSDLLGALRTRAATIRRR